MNCYSRYFNTTDDVRTELELKPKFRRSTSLQDGSKKTRDAKTTLDFCSPFDFEEAESFDNLKTNSAKPKISKDTKCEGNKEEKGHFGKKYRCFDAEFQRRQLESMDKISSKSEEDSAIRLADVFTTVNPPAKEYCQCFQDNSKAVFQVSNTGRDSENFQNVPGHLVSEDIPSEIKCGKCHLEIQEEWRRRKMVIESWMEFFGSRGTSSNSIYTYASSV